MKWGAFHPFVMPYVLGCPIPTMEHHVREAAIEFCRMTKCWQQRLDAETTDGTTVFVDLVPPVAGAIVHDVEDVEVDGVEWGVISAEAGQKKARETTSERFCFVYEPETLAIYPMQAAACEVVANVSLLPSETATEFPDSMKKYMRYISDGAIASLKALPGQPFTAADSDTFELRFRDRIRSESARLARGSVATGHGRIPPSFI